VPLLAPLVVLGRLVRDHHARLLVRVVVGRSKLAHVFPIEKEVVVRPIAMDSAPL